jgi:hypothetical protein
LSGRGVVRIALGYMVDDYCLRLVGGGVVSFALAYMVDDCCLSLVGGGAWFELLLVILWTIIA